MTYSNNLAISTLSAIETTARVALATLDAGVTARRYFDIAWGHYHNLFLGDAAVTRYETIGYRLGTGLVIVFALAMEGLDRLQAWVDEEVDSCIAEVEPGAEPEAIVIQPLNRVQVFGRLLRELIFDIYDAILFVVDTIQFVIPYVRGHFPHHPRA